MFAAAYNQPGSFRIGTKHMRDITLLLLFAPIVVTILYTDSEPNWPIRATDLIMVIEVLVVMRILAGLPKREPVKRMIGVNCEHTLNNQHSPGNTNQSIKGYNVYDGTRSTQCRGAITAIVTTIMVCDLVFIIANKTAILTVSKSSVPLNFMGLILFDGSVVCDIVFEFGVLDTLAELTLSSIYHCSLETHSELLLRHGEIYPNWQSVTMNAGQSVPDLNEKRTNSILPFPFSSQVHRAPVLSAQENTLRPFKVASSLVSPTDSRSNFDGANTMTFGSFSRTHSVADNTTPEFRAEQPEPKFIRNFAKVISIAIHVAVKIIHFLVLVPIKLVMFFPIGFASLLFATLSMWLRITLNILTTVLTNIVIYYEGTL